MTSQEFFTKYPNAKEVIQVGDSLFLSSCKLEAEIYSKRQKKALKIIKRPKASK